MVAPTSSLCVHICNLRNNYTSWMQHTFVTLFVDGKKIGIVIYHLIKKNIQICIFVFQSWIMPTCTTFTAWVGVFFSNERDLYGISVFHHNYILRHSKTRASRLGFFFIFPVRNIHRVYIHFSTRSPHMCTYIFAHFSIFFFHSSCFFHLCMSQVKNEPNTIAYYIQWMNREKKNHSNNTTKTHYGIESFNRLHRVLSITCTQYFQCHDQQIDKSKWMKSQHSLWWREGIEIKRWIRIKRKKMKTKVTYMIECNRKKRVKNSFLFCKHACIT